MAGRRWDVAALARRPPGASERHRFFARWSIGAWHQLGARGCVECKHGRAAAHIQNDGLGELSLAGWQDTDEWERAVECRRRVVVTQSVVGYYPRERGVLAGRQIAGR